MRAPSAPSDALKPALRLAGVTAGYGHGSPIIHDVDLTVAPGALVALIGPNGSGKSTLLKTVCRLTTVQSGSLIFGEADLLAVGSHQLCKLGIGYVPQHDGVFPTLSVLDNLRVGGISLSKARSRERVHDVMELLPVLRERAAAPAGSLSGGEQRLVSVGRALVADPGLLLMDEPTAGLSPKAAEDILSHVDHLHRVAQLSVLLVEQNAMAAVDIADSVHVLSAGAIAFSGTGSALREDGDLAALYLGGGSTDG
jgi:ABC-type branched-subunit amino acid transport system ATPase component